MRTYILKEGVLNDDTLYVAEEGKVFSGGYIAIVEKWVYQNTQSNRLITKCFRKQARLDAFISKNYPNFEYND